MELLEGWRIEDATDSPELIQRAEEEIVEFKATMNDNRARSGEPFIYP